MGKTWGVKFTDLSSKVSSATFKLGGLEQTPQSLVPQIPHLQNEIVMPSLRVSCKAGGDSNKKIKTNNTYHLRAHHAPGPGQIALQ